MYSRVDDWGEGEGADTGNTGPGGMAARALAGGLEDREEVETEEGAERSDSVDSLSAWRAGP